jgi:hypothetical protein
VASKKQKPAVVKQSAEKSNFLAWVLIILGLIFFIQNTIDIDFATLWPLILVAIGVKMIWK